MVRKLLVWSILIPIALILVLFAVANREVVTVSFDPFDSAQPAFALRMPLFALIFVFLILGVLVGGIAAWLRQGRHRQTARSLRTDLAGLRREVEILNARLDDPQGSASAGAGRLPVPPMS